MEQKCAIMGIMMRNEQGTLQCLQIQYRVLKQYTVKQGNTKNIIQYTTIIYNNKHYPNTFTTLAEHFNSKGHSMNDFSFMPIDKINNNWKRLLKETEWMYKRNTVLPGSMIRQCFIIYLFCLWCTSTMYVVHTCFH